jgi:two-component system, LuxR family, response regulator FixJ
MPYEGLLVQDQYAGLGRFMSELSTIFIVDDDDAVRDSLKFLLESVGFTVADFNSTRDFLDGYRPGTRQCLVLDHHLAGETGLDFMESSTGAALGVPVILVSAGGDPALQERASRCGIRAFFHKPVDKTALIAKITEIVGDPSTAEMAP